MTNAIGTGTANLCANVPIDERDEVARAGGHGRMGEFIREMYLIGLEVRHPDIARKVKEIRARYYGNKAAIDRAAASSVLLGLVLLVTGLQWLGADQDIRRPRNQVARVVRAARRVEA